MRRILVKSYAKINLAIDVGPKEEDGYHPVDMVLQALTLHDDVTIGYRGENSDFGRIAMEAGDTEGRVFGFQIAIKTNKKYLPTDSRNLAYKAAALMLEKYQARVPDGSCGRIDIEIYKRIPVAAGLAGGSGNAAAVVHGLNVLWNLNLSLREIMDICSELGSDVPFCAMSQAAMASGLPKKVRADNMAGACARGKGRGTELSKLKFRGGPVVIAKPNISVKTAEVYEGIDNLHIEQRPDIDSLVSDLEQGNPGMYDNFINVLEEYTVTNYEKVRELKEIMEQKGSKKVLMSGSGPTVFAVYGEMKDAIKASDDLRRAGYESYFTKMQRSI